MDGDPFSANAAPSQSQQHRFSAFDTQLFALNRPDSSPAQAKKALEAHLAETDRKIQEASKLGSTLVQQRVNLANSLREVSSRSEGNKISPELRQKLVEIEKEYNEVGRQSAKASIGLASDGSAQEGHPHVRPASPSKLAGNSIDTPSKMNLPRKQRNQASNSDHIEFAAEITTSLLGQVRHLQAVLAERDDTLKTIEGEKARLETEAQGFGMRLKHLDDSEQRYKDENWNLETQLQDLTAKQKEITSREQKLQQNIGVLTSERSAYEKELEDIKRSHGKAYEDHTALRKHHESEILALRKDANEGENERTSLQKKVDELTSQNHELARGLAVRWHESGSKDETDTSEPVEDFSLDPSDFEQSPPPSPSKGQRHSMLESETLKSSLNHAHRMIQSLKSNIHKEKSEKQDLKRMLQDARDELEIKRRAPQEKRLKSKSQTDIKKAARPGLGAARTSKTDVMMNDPTQDPEWEDHEGSTPEKLLASESSVARRPSPNLRTDSSDAYQTANETEDAFETANERDTTDNDAFQTGTESLAGDSSETETETENVVTRASTIKGHNAPNRISTVVGDRRSIQSTASTSDEDEQALNTPIQGQPQRFRLKMGRRPRIPSGAPGSSAPSSTKNSPASFTNAGNEGGQSLFTELENISGDEADGTPSKPSVNTPRSVRSLSRDVGGKRSTGSLRKGFGSQPSTPGLRPASAVQNSEAPPVPRIPTVDSGVMTEPWDPTTESHPPQGTRVVSGSTDKSTPQRPVWDQPLNFVSGMIPGFRESANTTPMSTRSSMIQVRQVEDQNNDRAAPSTLTLSPIHTVETAPSQAKQSTAAAPGSPTSSTGTPTRESPEAPAGGIFGSVFGWNRRSRRASVTRVAEDSPSQQPKDSLLPVTPEVKKPLREVSPNVVSKGAVASEPSLSEDEEKRRSIYDQASQTVLSSDQIDRMLARQTVVADTQPTSAGAAMKPLSDIGAIAPQTPIRGIDNDATPKAKVPEVKIPQGAAFRDQAGKSIRRPTSANSTRSRVHYPPLPPDHQEAIAAAAQKAPESMGPPLAPASAYPRSYRSRAGSRPQTPSLQGLPSPSSKGGTTPRAGRYSTARSQVSRRSSVSSFASELDERFGIRAENMPMQGMPANTDPRMIQAITQTMIGEHMWKYTRKAGRGDMSNSRHRRFFWVHPYTRTLYWSDRDPATAKRAELKSKSVAIEAVRVVTDDNPSPPGLHRKSLVIVTPGRNVKFTAQTSHRHETWFNALSYLLLRTGGEGDGADGELDANDIAEFNPNYNRRSARSRVSMASFRSSHTANRNVRSSLSSRANPSNRESQQSALETTDERPGTSSSIRQRISRSLSRSRGSRPNISNPIPDDPEPTNSTPHASISSRLSGYWKQPPSFRNSMRSRSSVRVDEARTSSIEPGVLEGGRSVVAPPGNESAEDLRKVIEERDRDPALENVRACCDGKSNHPFLSFHYSSRYCNGTDSSLTGRHDVGSLSKDGRHQHHHHNNVRSSNSMHSPRRASLNNVAQGAT